jgi:hypothetical protein
MKVEWDKVAGRSYFILGVLALIAIPAVLAYMGLGIIGVLFALPILAWIGARLLVHGGASAFSWLSMAQYKKWEGAYYAFNDVQVRVYEEDGQLWFVLPDVLRSIGMKEVPAAFRAVHPGDVRDIPGHRLKGLNPQGLERLLAKAREHEAGRFLLWMQREVVKPWEKKKERGL